MKNPGNLTKAKTEEQVVSEARALEGSNFTYAVHKIGIGRARLHRIADQYGIFLPEREPPISDEQILAAIRENQFDHSVYTLALKIGTIYTRVIKVAEEAGIEMQVLRKPSNLRGLFYDDKGYARKMCSCCREEKGAEFFTEDPSKVLSGLSSWCNQCKHNKHALKRALEALPV